MTTRSQIHILTVGFDEATRDQLLPCFDGPSFQFQHIAADKIEGLRQSALPSIGLVLVQQDHTGFCMLQIIRTLRETKAAIHVPILVYADTHDQNLELAALEAGASDYLSGSFPQVNVRARIKNQLHLALFYRQYEEKTRQLTAKNQALKESERRFRQIAENIQEMFWIYELGEERYSYINPAFTHITGRDTQSLMDCPKTFFDLFVEEDVHIARQAIRHLRNGAVSDIELRVRHTSGLIKWVRFQAIPFRDSQGQVYRLAGVTQDISQQKAYENKLERLSMTDSLTGLANRRQFDQTLHLEWHRHLRQNLPLTLVLIDIDFFKEFNDSKGHLAGDHCLRKVAQVLHEATKRITDLVARYGGEEFAMILPNTQIAGAQVVANRIHEKLADLAILNPNSKVSANLTVSVGVAETVPTMASDAEYLIRVADSALYRAKSQGRNQTILIEQSSQTESTTT